MIYISKGRVPRSLIEYRRQPNANYNDFRDKPDVQRSLLEEQGFLCAYCMKRIRQDTAQIEHIFPQHPEEGDGELLALEYTNMLGVCDGYESLSEKYQTCDSHKKNRVLRGLNPLRVNSVDRIAYRTDGTIYSTDAIIDGDLNDILNLNCERVLLKKNRKAAIVELQDYLKKHQLQGLWDQGVLEHAQRHFETLVNGSKHEYLGVILYFIKRYLQRLE